MSESNDTDARKSETTVQRRDNWNDGEIRVLLDMWADDKIQESLESSGRNIVVYRGKADRFKWALRYGEPGTDGLPERSAKSCRTKIKSLQQQYKKVPFVQQCIVGGVVISSTQRMCTYQFPA